MATPLGAGTAQPTSFESSPPLTPPSNSSSSAPRLDTSLPSVSTYSPPGPASAIVPSTSTSDVPLSNNTALLPRRNHTISSASAARAQRRLAQHFEEHQQAATAAAAAAASSSSSSGGSGVPPLPKPTRSSTLGSEGLDWEIVLRNQSRDKWDWSETGSAATLPRISSREPASDPIFATGSLRSAGTGHGRSESAHTGTYGLSLGSDDAFFPSSSSGPFGPSRSPIGRHAPSASASATPAAGFGDRDPLESYLSSSDAADSSAHAAGDSALGLAGVGGAIRRHQSLNHALGRTMQQRLQERGAGGPSTTADRFHFPASPSRNTTDADDLLGRGLVRGGSLRVGRSTAGAAAGASAPAPFRLNQGEVSPSIEGQMQAAWGGGPPYSPQTPHTREASLVSGGAVSPSRFANSFASPTRGRSSEQLSAGADAAAANAPRSGSPESRANASLSEEVHARLRGLTLGKPTRELSVDSNATQRGSSDAPADGSAHGKPATKRLPSLITDREVLARSVARSGGAEQLRTAIGVEGSVEHMPDLFAGPASAAAYVPPIGHAHSRAQSSESPIAYVPRDRGYSDRAPPTAVARDDWQWREAQARNFQQAQPLSPQVQQQLLAQQAFQQAQQQGGSQAAAFAAGPLGNPALSQSPHAKMAALLDGAPPQQQGQLIAMMAAQGVDVGAVLAMQQAQQAAQQQAMGFDAAMAMGLGGNGASGPAGAGFNGLGIGASPFIDPRFAPPGGSGGPGFSSPPPGAFGMGGPPGRLGAQQGNQQAPLSLHSLFNNGPNGAVQQASGVDSTAFSAPSKEVQELIAKKGFNPDASTFDLNPRYAKFYVCKSFEEADVQKSLKHEIWASTEKGNARLDKAFREHAAKGPVYIFFSVNGSGHFAGMAQMLTGVDYSTSSNVWAQEGRFKGVFSLKWHFVKDIPNAALRHLKLTNTPECKSVTQSRDSQPLPDDVGREMLRIFATYQAKTSLLMDWEYYERLLPQSQQSGGASPGQGNGNSANAGTPSLGAGPSAPHTPRLAQQQQHRGGASSGGITGPRASYAASPRQMTMHANSTSSGVPPGGNGAMVTGMPPPFLAGNGAGLQGMNLGGGGGAGGGFPQHQQHGVGGPHPGPGFGGIGFANGGGGGGPSLPPAPLMASNHRPSLPHPPHLHHGGAGPVPPPRSASRVPHSPRGVNKSGGAGGGGGAEIQEPSKPPSTGAGAPGGGVESHGETGSATPTATAGTRD